MIYSEIQKINIERISKANSTYNPITGEGSISVKREWREFKCFPLNKIMLPQEMLEAPLTKNIISLGIENYLKKIGKEVNNKNVAQLWIKFCKERVKHDFEYWARTMTIISDKGGGRDIPFTLNYPQRLYLCEMERLRIANRPIDIILCKARQWGGSTLTQLYMLWIQLVHKSNWNSVICGDIEKQSSIVSGMLTKVINNYPVWATNGQKIKISPYQGSAKTRIISWGNSRYSLGSSQRPDSLRSEDISMAHLTEVGLWKSTLLRKPEDLVQSIFGSIASAPYTMKVIESTAKGVGNFFHRTWIDAISGRNNFTPVFIPWYSIELYRQNIEEKDYKLFIESMNDYEKQLFEQGAMLESIAWYRYKKREIGDEWRLFSEFPSSANEAFQSSGRRVFRINYVQRARKDCIPPAFIGEIISKGTSELVINDKNRKKLFLENLEFIACAPGENTKENNLCVWLFPDKESNYRNRYIVTVDVGGRSVKSDYSCILVADRLSMLDGGVPEIAACWHGHIEHDKLAWKAAQIAQAYNQALLVIEANTLETEGTEGDNFEYILNEISNSYTNLYSRTSAQDIRQGRARRWGFHTNPSTKPMVINFLLKSIRDGLYIERCIETTYELDTYEIKENGREMGAIQGNNDDRVMATAILVWICYNWPLPSAIERVENKKRRNRIISEASL